MKDNYHPEPYWSRVAQEMGKRGSDAFLAGDDEPYYAYKRSIFLKLLNSISFKDKSVLEIGSGPGGNLIEILKQNPRSVSGADISDDMIALANKNINNKHVELTKINGVVLPFNDRNFDLVFSATVLQHNTDDLMMKSLLKEMCRVTKEKLILFEKVDSSVKGTELCMARPVSYYEDIVNSSGFKLDQVEFSNIRASYYVSGAIRKIFNPSSYLEGDPAVKMTCFLQSISLPITKVFDKIFSSKKDLAKMVFIPK